MKLKSRASLVILLGCTHQIAKLKEDWEGIGDVKGLFKGSWVICGDYNVSRFVSEKRSDVRRTIGTGEFPDFIEDMGRIDLQMENATFT